MGLIIALMINYGNQMHAAVEITEPTCHKFCKTKRTKMMAEIGMRTFILIASGNLTLIIHFVLELKAQQCSLIVQFYWH